MFLFISFLFLVTPTLSAVAYTQLIQHSPLSSVDTLYDIDALTSQIESSLGTNNVGDPYGFIVIFENHLLATEGYNRLVQTSGFTLEDLFRLQEFPVLIVHRSSASLRQIISLNGVTKILPNIKLENMIDIAPPGSFDGIPELAMNVSRDIPPTQEERDYYLKRGEADIVAEIEQEMHPEYS